MRRLIAIALSLCTWAGNVQAAPVVLSAKPDRVAVTLYQDPARGDGPIDRDAPSSFALITETRTITLPPGFVTVRFEGVASGIVPQSAILFGVDPRERNRDAALLSQAGLVDAYTGQQVVLRRTDPATGTVSEERATIRSAADRMIVTTSRGAEAVYCSGLAQTLLYPEAPATLSAKPVLTMTTTDQPGGTVTITLAYIATGFDWDATYVGTIADNSTKLGLFAWLTMASADETSFTNATLAAVAGRINRSDDTNDDTAADAISAARRLDRTSRCWPQGTTSDQQPLPSPGPPPPPMMIDLAAADIVVTAKRRTENIQDVPIAITAHSESLGDLKLYRVPVAVTVAARSQKQVAFLADRRISGALIYRSKIYCCGPDEPVLLYRFRNTKSSGLGEPLPAGKVILYQESAEGRRLVGQSTLANRTVDEEIQLIFGASHGVTVATDSVPIAGGTRYAVTVRNANLFAVRYEAEFSDQASFDLRRVSDRLSTKAGKRVWSRTLPPVSETVLRYDRVAVEDDQAR